MRLDSAQLSALRAVVDEGTFDAAARVLRVTPSAVSQRIRALEDTVGRVLVRRSKPITVTESGESLLRLARQIDLLTDDVSRELDHHAGKPAAPAVRVPIAVNADSLATWILPVLAPLVGQVTVEFHREDQSRTSALLRDGTVVGAVTAQANPVHGCTSEFLGSLRYRPVASRTFVNRWLPDKPAGASADTQGAARASAIAVAPMVVFDREDSLQHEYLRALRTRSGEEESPPARMAVHQVPGSADFVTAVRLGFGWGMVPDLQRTPGDHLVNIDPGFVLDVPLYWQQWNVRTPTLDSVAAALRAAGRQNLIQTPALTRRGDNPPREGC